MRGMAALSGFMGQTRTKTPKKADAGVGSRRTKRSRSDSAASLKGLKSRALNSRKARVTDAPGRSRTISMLPKPEPNRTALSPKVALKWLSQFQKKSIDRKLAVHTLINKKLVPVGAKSVHKRLKKF